MSDIVPFGKHKGATKEQFVQFFQSQGVRVIFESDVDAVVMPSSEGDPAQ